MTISDFYEAVRKNVNEAITEVEKKNSTVKEKASIVLCGQEDCPLHPNADHKDESKMYAKTTISSREYEICMVCIFCEHAIKQDMKELAKRIVLKSKIRKNGN